MSKRIEKGILDKLINGKLLGKRKLGSTTKYIHENTRSWYSGKFIDSLYFPKTKLDRFLANVYESCMPGFQFFFWNEQVRWAREYGYTLGEKFYHSFGHAQNIMFHALGQNVHPWGWLESQRRDSFIRKVTVLLPGIQAPDWAQESRRVPDLDLNSISVPLRALDVIFREATPAPHCNPPNYTALHHIFNQRNNFGMAASRLFYNEELRGDYYSTGILNKSDRAQINSWYADAQHDSQKDRIDNLNEIERSEYQRAKERWDKNFDQFYPELRVMKHNPIKHKYDEPYYERNINEIRSSIFTSKWVDAIEKDKFTSDEVQKINEFFIEGNTSNFFNFGEEDSNSEHNPHEHKEYKPTELYKKFISTLNFPDFFLIDRFTTYPPEKQFYDLMDENWGINFDTVDAYKSRYLQMIDSKFDSNLSSLLLEEVYNPLFREVLKEKFQLEGKQNDSLVLKAIKKGIDLNNINELANGAKENTNMTSTKVLGQMVDTQVRKVVKTLHVKGKH